MVRYEDRMARALASVLNMLDPDVVVLGGGLSQVARLYQNVPRLWGKYAFSDQVVDPAAATPTRGRQRGARGGLVVVGGRVARARRRDRGQRSSARPTGCTSGPPGFWPAVRSLLHRQYEPVQALDGVSFSIARRGAGRLSGTQRRGQDHDAEDPVGAAVPDQRSGEGGGVRAAPALGRVPAHHHPGDGAEAAAAVGSAAGGDLRHEPGAVRHPPGRGRRHAEASWWTCWRSAR